MKPWMRVAIPLVLLDLIVGIPLLYADYRFFAALYAAVRHGVGV